MTELTDEQLGRKWCERHGKRPWHRPRYDYAGQAWHWVYDDGPEYALPHQLWVALYDTARMSRFPTEAAAYAAVGAALCSLKVRAGEIAAVLGGVL